MRFRWGIFGILLSANLCALPAPVTSLTIDGLVTYVRQHPEVREIADLLPALPQSYRRQLTLMYRSHSSQDASPSAPRVILYGDDATLLLAFNGEAKQEGFNRLEMIEFHPESARFEFRELHFPEKGPGEVEPSESNPSRCLACHGGADPRPNWEHYDSWPGAFAEQDDRLVSAPPSDYLAMHTFLERAENLPRYQYLPYLREGYAGSRRTDVEHNIVFNQRVAALNFQRVVRLMRAQLDYDSTKYAALGVLWCIGDLPTFFPPALRQKLQPALADLQDFRHISSRSFIPLFEALGRPAKYWSMDFLAAEPAFDTPYNDRMTVTGFLANSDPDLRAFVQYEPLNYHGASLYVGQLRDGQCDALRDRSLRALAQ